MKPELQNRPETQLDWAMDYLKFLSATDNMNIVIDNYLVYSSKPKVVNHVDE